MKNIPPDLKVIVNSYGAHSAMWGIIHIFMCCVLWLVIYLLYDANDGINTNFLAVITSLLMLCIYIMYLIGVIHRGFSFMFFPMTAWTKRYKGTGFHIWLRVTRDNTILKKNVYIIFNSSNVEQIIKSINVIADIDKEISRRFNNDEFTDLKLLSIIPPGYILRQYNKANKDIQGVYL